jgi:hypothetical protein
VSLLIAGLRRATSAPWITAERCSPSIEVGVAEVAHEDRLRRGDEAEALHLAHLPLVDEAAVLDAVAAVAAGAVGTGLVEGADGLVDGGVADGVHRHLEAAVMVVAHHLVELAVAEDQHAEVAVGVGLQHGRGAAAGAAVGEELTATRSIPLPLPVR